MGTLVFAVAEPPDLAPPAPSEARTVDIDVQRVPRTTTPDDAAVVPSDDESVVPGVARRASDELAEPDRGRSLQDHDDVEESDRTDRERREGDGSVVNGDFEGSSSARGHNFTTSNSDAPGEGDD